MGGSTESSKSGASSSPDFQSEQEARRNKVIDEMGANSGAADPNGQKWANLAATFSRANAGSGSASAPSAPSAPAKELNTDPRNSGQTSDDTALTFEADRPWNIESSGSEKVAQGVEKGVNNAVSVGLSVYGAKKQGQAADAAKKKKQNSNPNKEPDFSLLGGVDDVS